MKKINAVELRKLFLNYYEEKGHKIIPSSSLIPENDPTVLFTTAGMHPLVPYLLGENHPEGKRLASCQKCIRTSDIEDVGDDSHLTFFEMLGNWSLGDYFKKQAIEDSYEFLVKYLEIPKEKLYFTVFKGDSNIAKDEESYNIWKSLGVEEDHIFYLDKKHNWWSLGTGLGPCGPDTEMFFDTGKKPCSDNCNPACDCGKFVEIWNNVFMQYNALEKGKLEPLKKPNVDTGMGLERVVSLLNNKDSVYDTDLFLNLKTKLEELSTFKYENKLKDFRIVLDHVRTAVFILGDDKKIRPSNTEEGYVLRRIIRRAIRHLKEINIDDSVLSLLAKIVINDYKDFYPELKRNYNFIIEELEKEEQKFNKTIKKGIKEFQKIIEEDTQKIDGKSAFKLYDTFGFPIEFTVELAKEKGLSVDVEGYEKEFIKHQEKSRQGSSSKFKGGLADNNYDTVKYHTATHILHSVLRDMFGPSVEQRGANITSKRLRFDFSFNRKLTEEEKKEIEKRVNDIINKGYDVVCEEMEIDKARKSGAVGIFNSKYGSMVKVYTIADISKEICGGPHVSNLSELGVFKIKKEESSSSGVRRIRAILE